MVAVRQGLVRCVASIASRISRLGDSTMNRIACVSQRTEGDVLRDKGITNPTRSQLQTKFLAAQLPHGPGYAHRLAAKSRWSQKLLTNLLSFSVRRWSNTAYLTASLLSVDYWLPLNLRTAAASSSRFKLVRNWSRKSFPLDVRTKFQGLAGCLFWGKLKDTFLARGL